MLTGIHYLRGICAISVVIFHSITLFALQRGVPPSWPHYILASGVDVFFVISGFLMVRTTKQYSATRLDRGVFIRKRLARIAPLYWVLTGALTIAIFLHPSLSAKPVDGAMFLRSMLFLPTDLGRDTVQTTIISAGWTLVYEMFFYLLFALFTGIHYRRGLVALVAAIVALSLVHPFVNNFYLRIYTNPIMIEFAFGIAIALLPELTTDRRATLVTLLGVGVIAVGTAIGGEALTLRFLEWGVGAALIVYGASGLRVRRQISILMLLGDASYATYLMHMYFVKFSGAFFHSSILGWAAPALIAGAAGVAGHKLLEKPIQGMLSKPVLRRRATA